MNRISKDALTEEDKKTIIRISLKFVGLGVKADFSYKTIGPVVSTYYFDLAYSIPISKILGKEEDIALACHVSSVLISRAESKIAISIPNLERQIVSFDSCLYAAMLRQGDPKTRLELPLLLGQNTYGDPVAIDLEEQPHVLIAGSTGGGKSILLQSLLSGLALLKAKDDLRLILVDTKKLDLSLFSTLPQVVDSVENPEQMHNALSRLMTIVRKRTDAMKGVARNITEYNKLNPTSKLPYYVVVIDEVADLIDQDKNQIEWKDPRIEDYPRLPQRITSLLQICRAAGVHVICATQRSSVDVVKGVIKANLPTRIALKTASRADSQCILSQSGAQNLLGKGDMLVESCSFNGIQRFHGAYISSNDIGNILSNADSIRKQFQLV